ncbi:MAG: hypothetical protein HY815_22320 [Candidatus Riflebacteria bacterium]|nr:hypothetical protein [Candidatus Riflebacteria bacterium]
MSKLSRAMIEGLADARLSLADKIGSMLAELESRSRYDLVLIDARAGLAELAAGPLLTLGANALIFGTAQPQTLDGLRFLFAHLSSLVAEEQRSPWQALKMVHAKAPLTDSTESFKDQLWELFADFLYEEQEGIEGFNFDADDPAAPHCPIVIPLDTAFADWNPTEKPGKIVEAYYTRTFQGLLRYVDELLEQAES